MVDPSDDYIVKWLIGQLRHILSLHIQISNEFIDVIYSKEFQHGRIRENDPTCKMFYLFQYIVSWKLKLEIACSLLTADMT